MPGHPASSEVRGTDPANFVGRADQLAQAARRWHAASAGPGHLLLIAGEAGIGKTRLLRELGRAVSGATRITTSVFPRDIETVGGVILDLAAELTRTGSPEVGTELRDRLLAGAAGGGDASRGRRLLVSDLAARITRILDSELTLLCIEDLHWADELSLDVLERVAGALHSVRGMVVATFRSDELYPRTPLRRMRSRLLEQRLAEEITLPRLTATETADLVGILDSSKSEQELDSLFDRSGGIPLYIEELLADPSGAVPVTIADAIAGRLGALSPSTIPILQAAAVIGRSFDIDLLVRVSEEPPGVVDAALSELSARNLVLTGVDDQTLDFRHALIRDAIYEGIPVFQRRNLHAKVAAAAVDARFRDAYISDQFERARNPAAAYEYARAAAADAMRASAHREAVELFRRSQRNAPDTISVTERASLHAELAGVLEATDDNVGAAIQFAAAIDLLRRDGDEVSAARLLPRLASINHLLGFDLDQRTAIIDDELARLDATGMSVPSDVRAGLLAAAAAANMLDRRLDEALELSAAASELAVGDDRLALDLDLTSGAALVFAGSGDRGWRQLEGAVDRASATHQEATAARGYRMLSSSASVLVEYPRAREWLAAGMDYSAATERWNDHHYIASHAAHVAWATGEYERAEKMANRALRDAGSGITTRNVALIVLGFVALVRGDVEEARTHLEEALAIGERMHELQRLQPPLWGLAELALLQDDARTAAELCERGLGNSEPLGDAAYLFPFLLTGTRAYLALHDTAAARLWLERASALLRRRDIPGTRPAIGHAEGLLQLAAGQTGAARVLLEEARSGWAERERFWEGTWALVDLAACATRSRRPRAAVALLGQARALAEASGARVIVFFADAAMPDQLGAGPLSVRELDVARLVAAGATNREIAEQLVISPKTASSHVEHILAKLGASRRAEIAAWVSRTNS